MHSTSLTRRDLLAGAARAAVGAAVAGPALRLVVASPARAAAATGDAGLTEACYWECIDPIAARMDHMWDADAATRSG